MNYKELENKLNEMQKQPNGFEYKWSIYRSPSQYRIIATKIFPDAEAEHWVCVVSNDVGPCSHCIFIYNEPLSKEQTKLIQAFARQDSKTRDKVRRNNDES